MCDNTNTTTQSIADYLSQLLKDRKQLAAFPNVFIHVERLLDEGESVISRFLFFFSFLSSPSLALRPLFHFFFSRYRRSWNLCLRCHAPAFRRAPKNFSDTRLLRA